MDTTIELNGMLSLAIPIDVDSSIHYAIQDGLIRFNEPASLVSTLENDLRVVSLLNGRIRFEGESSLEVQFYGLTVPAVDNLELTFEALSELVVFTEISSIIVTPFDDSILVLTDNAITIPMSLEVVLVLENGTYVPPPIEYDFLNAILMGMEFIFINGLNFDFASVEYILPNKLTVSLTLELNITNKVLLQNETSKEWVFVNKIAPSQTEVYNGFYFSKIHGV